MHNSSLKFNKRNNKRNKYIAVTLMILFFGAYFSASAIGSPYSAGATLDPSCAPGDLNCTVSMSSYSFSSGLAESNGNVTLGGTLNSGDYISIGGFPGVQFEIDNDPDYPGIYLSTQHPDTTGSYSSAFLQMDGEEDYSYNSLSTRGSSSNYKSELLLETNDGVTGTTSENIDLYAQNRGNSVQNRVDIIGYAKTASGVDSRLLKFVSTSNTNILTITVPDVSVLTGSHYMPLSVNGHFADSAGDITVNESPITVVNTSNLFSTGLSSTGSGVTSVNHSIFFGQSAGYNATNASDSNFIGYNTGANATNASNSNFIGYSSGGDATNASDSNFFGNYTGKGATGASDSNFMGNRAGYSATNASNSNFLGNNAGRSASSAYNSNFFGLQAGELASGAYASNFIGSSSGANSTDAYKSNFIGVYAGTSAANANNSNFIGFQAGDFATNAANSIFIGQKAGYNDFVDNSASTDDFSILIGNSTNTGGFSNSIALGAYATNTATNQFMIGSTTRPIDTTIWNGTGGTTCTVTTGTGISCSSDERLKTNIEDLPDNTLDKLLNVKTVTYNWKKGNTEKNNIGFIAQDLQQYFPELVHEDSNGYLSVFYANMTPVLVESIKEMNLKLELTTSLDVNTKNSLGYLINKFLGNVSNGINIIFSNEVRTKRLCIDDLCINKSQLEQILEEQAQKNNLINTNDNSSQTQSGDNEQSSNNDQTQSDQSVENTKDTSSDNSSDSVDDGSNNQTDDNSSSDNSANKNTDTSTNNDDTDNTDVTTEKNTDNTNTTDKTTNSDNENNTDTKAVNKSAPEPTPTSDTQIGDGGADSSTL